MVIIMEKKFVWKEITSDGLMKEPKECGPGYSTESINGWGGFDNEEDALAKLEQMKKNYKWEVSGDFVLVAIYSP